MARHKFIPFDSLDNPQVPTGPVLGCYCEGCPKNIPGTGTCLVYPDPIAKTGAERDLSIGCPFSPREEESRLEEFYANNPRQRVGQQKQVKKKRR